MQNLLTSEISSAAFMAFPLLACVSMLSICGMGLIFVDVHFSCMARHIVFQHGATLWKKWTFSGKKLDRVASSFPG